MDNTESNEDYHFKSASLIYAATPDMTGLMMNTFALMLTYMSEESWRDKFGNDITPEFTFNSDQLCEWFGYKRKQLGSYLKRSSDALSKKNYGFEVDDNDWGYFPLFTAIKYKAGTLTMKPNPELRAIYIINSNPKGHAKIDNQVFKALPNPNEKRVFEFLCRYKGDKQMYFIFVKKLQVIFGVLKENGEPIKKSYKTESHFINKVIKPALIAISLREEAKGKLEVLTGSGGEIGYEIEKSKRGENKIRFLVKWNEALTEKETETKIIELKKMLKLHKKYYMESHTSKNTLASLEEVIYILDTLEWETERKGLQARLNEIKKKIKIEQYENKMDIDSERNKFNLDLLGIFENK